MEMTELNKEFSLLKRIVTFEDSFEQSVDLSDIEKLIFTKLPETLEGYAPVNFPQLYFDFKYEYDRFKEFILYDRLIGKNVVALGGGFSTGKSSFLNSLLGSRVLPVEISASTSVPAYLVHDGEMSAYGVNTFGSRFALDPEDVKVIAHGFGREDDEGRETTLGHIVDSIFISSPQQKYENIALLDTPGYSKAESEFYSAKTDEQIARAQLNSSNYIIWFVQVESGTIKKEDVEFLKTLNHNIPILFIVNKVDKVIEEDRGKIVENIRTLLSNQGIPCVDVLTFTRKKGVECDREKIDQQLEKWNQAVVESRFAYNFKVLFTQCKAFYDEQLALEEKRLNRINKANTFAENADVQECLSFLEKETKRNIDKIKSYHKELKNLQDVFFTEIKRIADKVNIQMPEPSEIDLIRDKIVDPKEVLDAYCEKQGIRENKEFTIILSDVFADIKPVFNRLEGNGGHAAELLRIIEDNLVIDPDQIRYDFQMKAY